MRRYLILEGELSAEEWRSAINDTLCPEYWWLSQWKPATCCVNVHRERRGHFIELESFFIALVVGAAIDNSYPVRFRDAGNESPQMRAVVEWFKSCYRDITLVPAIAAPPPVAKRTKTKPKK